MIDEDKLAIDEEERIAGHEAIKHDIRDHVRSEIAASTPPADAQEAAEAKAVARHLKQRAVGDVVRTESELSRAKVFARISQVVDYIFGIIYGIIGLEIVLDLLGARPSSGFKAFIDRISAPLLAPFNGLMAEPSHGLYRLKLSYIIAFAVYILLHLAINGLLRLMAQRRATI